jgi:two-component system sensor histidine kinase HydH
VLHDVDQVETVVRGMLELAKPGELQKRPTSLKELLEGILRQLAPQLAHRKIQVETDIGSDLPELGLDQQRFRQALLNLIFNAADAMPDGGTLRISAVPTSQGRTVQLDVCDDGVGIDPAVAGRLFDAFVTTKRDGVGLGLLNTKAIVESHGGTIELTAREGRGTRARIELPAA